jgi:hypothetical protein
MPESPGLLGAYGLRLSGIAGAEGVLVRADPNWPAIEMVVRRGALDADAEYLDDDRARLRLRTGGWIDLDREEGRAVFTVPSPLSPEELIHPFLAPVAAVSAHWHGRESLHGGGLAHDGSVWGVIGGRLGGKSSLLAALALRGVDIVCDDVLVLEGIQAFAGPRTVDLRRDAAAALQAGENIGLAGARERWRLKLGPLDRRLSIAGWIFAAWADKVEMRRLPVADVLTRLLANRAINVPPEDPEALLQLGALPAWELRRPRSWAAMPDALDRLLGVLDGT